MDKWLDRPWTMRLVSLGLALLLVLSVGDQISGLSEVNINSPTNSEIVTDVPVTTYYDKNIFVVSGVPSKVKLSFSGPKNIIQSIIALNDYEVYVDLSTDTIGVTTKELLIKNISDKVTVKIEPSTAEITIQEKITREFPVTVDINNSLIDDNFVLKSATSTVESVKITGALEVINKIAFVKAVITSTSKISKNGSFDAEIQAFDQKYNKLNVQIKPSNLKVNVELLSVKKEVPFVYKQIGNLPDGYTIELIEIEPAFVDLIGKLSDIEQISEIEVPVNVANMTSTRTITVVLPIIEGIQQSLEEVKVTITVKRTN